MPRFLYLDREGVAISQDDWRVKSKDPAYTTVEQYDNGVVQITLKWVGRVVNPQDLFPGFYPVYVLLVKNYRSDGSLANDPVDNDKTFQTEAAAVEEYRRFLLEWTQCTTDEEGAFVEADNTLTPPKPPDPNLPSSATDELDGGAW